MLRQRHFESQSSVPRSLDVPGTHTLLRRKKDLAQPG